MLPLLIIIFSQLHLSTSIGPGLSRIHSRMQTDQREELSTVWDSNSMSTSNDANSYAYWNCHLIPPNMTLCKSVGYSRMVLPNFLQHESIREVIQQANVWVALVNTNCHPDIQRFLCSLYAPVCLKSHQEAKIPPCWELCDQVRNACLPRMRLFGFDWPEIVQCNQFPRLAESMCIPPQETPTVKCAPCEQAITLENIASSYCMADLVIKASLKDVIPHANRASLQLPMNAATRALKLVRRDGTIATAFDTGQHSGRHKHRRLRSQNLRSRKYRHINNSEGYTPYSNSYLMPHPHNRLRRFRRSESNWDIRTGPNTVNQLKRSSRNGDTQNAKKRRRARNLQFNDLDGIKSIYLGCSFCSSLLQYTTSDRAVSTLEQKRWLIMGRRIKEENTGQFTDELQVTFLTLWDRNSPEFRRSLHTIRSNSIKSICQKTPPVPSAWNNEQASLFNQNLQIRHSSPSESSNASSRGLRPNAGASIHQVGHSNKQLISQLMLPRYGVNTSLKLTRTQVLPVHDRQSRVALPRMPMTNDQLGSLYHRDILDTNKQEPKYTGESKSASFRQSLRSVNPPYTPSLSSPTIDSRSRHNRRRRRRRQREQRERSMYEELNKQSQPANPIEAPLIQKPIDPYRNEQPVIYNSPFEIYKNKMI